MDTINIVWFKRDLRLQDHAPLAKACEQSHSTLLLYILEPSLVKSDHYSSRHWRFVWQSLQDIQQSLEKYNIKLLSVYGPVKAVFQLLGEHVQINKVFSHQETGVNLTFRRDVAMADFFEDRGIRWKEFPTNAIQRGLMHRKGWRDKWKIIIDQQLAEPQLQQLTSAELPADCRQKLHARSFPDRLRQPDMIFQVGGEANAWNTLDDFIYNRSRHYNNFISAPGLAPVGCSRLSPYLAWGNISIRQLWHYLDSIPEKLH